MTTDELPNASTLIDEKIKQLGDWRGQTLSHVRKIITAVDAAIVEEIKWRGVPTWSLSGLICTGETYKSVVKFTFANGASLNDPAHLFNSSLEGNTRRAIDIVEGQSIDVHALKALVHAAIKFNQSKLKKMPKKHSV